jgi:hypothetical protein
LNTALAGRAGHGEDAAGGFGRWPSGPDGALVFEAGRKKGGGREKEVVGALKSGSTVPHPLALWSHGTASEAWRRAYMPRHHGFWRCAL